MIKVMVEISNESSWKILKSLKKAGFIRNTRWGSVLMTKGSQKYLLVVGRIPKKKMATISKLPGVGGIWPDLEIQGFGTFGPPSNI
ncbi:MAG: hypothetical protein AAB345_03370 [Patescibacteria group bacterium]